MWDNGLIGDFQCFRSHATASPFFCSHYLIIGAKEGLMNFVIINDNCEGQKSVSE